MVAEIATRPVEDRKRVKMDDLMESAESITNHLEDLNRRYFEFANRIGADQHPTAEDKDGGATAMPVGYADQLRGRFDYAHRLIEKLQGTLGRLEDFA